LNAQSLFGWDEIDNDSVIQILANHSIIFTRHPCSIRQVVPGERERKQWYLEGPDGKGDMIAIVIEIDSWNPVTQGVLTSICRVFGLDIQEFRATASAPAPLPIAPPQSPPD
jgi:hypothetical protein